MCTCNRAHFTCTVLAQRTLSTRTIQPNTCFTSTAFSTFRTALLRFFARITWCTSSSIGTFAKCFRRARVTRRLTLEDLKFAGQTWQTVRCSCLLLVKTFGAVNACKIGFTRTKSTRTTLFACRAHLLCSSTARVTDTIARRGKFSCQTLKAIL